MSWFYLNRHRLAATPVCAFIQSLPAPGKIIARSRSDKIVAVAVDRGELALNVALPHGLLPFDLAPPFATAIHFPDVDSAVLNAEGDWEPTALAAHPCLEAAWPNFLKQVLTRSSTNHSRRPLD